MTQKISKTRQPLIKPAGQAEKVRENLLRQYVEELAGNIGERNILLYTNLSSAAEFISTILNSSGYEVDWQRFEVDGKTCYNLEVEVPGTTLSNEILVIGAHYDTIMGSPGANDNATGVATVLTLAQAFIGRKLARTLRFVTFVNEEPPFFRSSQMGSLVYARSCRQRQEKIVAMLSLETIGYYTDEAKSQYYPFPLGFFYPTKGNFIAFVGNLRSYRLVLRLIHSFRSHSNFPARAGALPGIIPGIGWSDQWAFWRNGYPAVMVTDTALFRYPYYHTPQDTPDKINFRDFVRVVSGLEWVIADLVGVEE